jgi:hypothetical protein
MSIVVRLTRAAIAAAMIAAAAGVMLADSRPAAALLARGRSWGVYYTGLPPLLCGETILTASRDLTYKPLTDN